LKRLIVNADDFGFTEDVNRGIVVAHQRGILTATTIMATGRAFDDAARLARENPSLDVGVHLVLVGAEGFPPTISKLIAAIALKRIAIYDELARQMRRVLEAGIEPTHLDTHKHTHLLPPVLDAVARMSEEFDVPWVRRPFDFPMRAGGVPWTRRVVSGALGRLRNRFERTLTRHGCKTTDHFAGFQMTGHYDAAELAALIRELPEGSTEFMCHPGYCTHELRAARTRLRESRERELAALLSGDVKQSLADCEVHLAAYRDLS
jgi:predicted glycoside hydrolase/deacetylase ChbG (UPF0249 family)